MDIVEKPEDTTQPKEKKGKKKQITLERWRIATEKLQLASVRTTLTLIALGFTSYKVFYARTEAGLKPLLDFPNGRDIGMFLISVGFILLLLSTLQHLKNVARIKLIYKEVPYSVSLALSYLILVLSFVLLITVIFRL